jgi:DNA-directed RNA polymerase I, II, and III subunit RPABC1
MEFNHYKLIRRTIIEMLYDRTEQDTDRYHFVRGTLDLYNMIPDTVLEQILIDSESNFSNLNFELKNEREKVVVVFLKDASNLEKKINEYKKSYKCMNNDTLIVVLCNKEKPIDEYLNTDKKNVEIFWFKQLTFNVSKHSLVPKHEIINTLLLNNLKKTYLLNSINNLPTILNSDPVAKYYGMKIGDVCRITRHNENIGPSILYRLVTFKT